MLASDIMAATGDPFAAAVHLYEWFGFTECGPLGGHVDNGFSRFFTRPA